MNKFEEAERHYRKGMKINDSMTDGRRSTEMNYYSERVITGFINVLMNRNKYFEAKMMKLLISQLCFFTGQTSPRGLRKPRIIENSNDFEFDNVYEDQSMNSLPSLSISQKHTSFPCRNSPPLFSVTPSSTPPVSMKSIKVSRKLRVTLEF